MQQGIAPTLLEALKQADEDERVLAVRRLASRETAPAAVPALRSLLSDSDWIVRREAYFALQQIESSARGR